MMTTSLCNMMVKGWRGEGDDDNVKSQAAEWLPDDGRVHCCSDLVYLGVPFHSVPPGRLQIRSSLGEGNHKLYVHK